MKDMQKFIASEGLSYGLEDKFANQFIEPADGGVYDYFLWNKWIQKYKFRTWDKIMKFIKNRDMWWNAQDYVLTWQQVLTKFDLDSKLWLLEDRK